MKVLILGTDKTILDKDSKLSKRIQEYEKLVEKCTVFVPDSKNKIIGLIKVFVLSRRLLKMERYDVITVQDPYYLGFLGWILARKFKIGLNIQVHGWEKFYGLRKILAKFVLPRADSVRIVSQRLKNQLINEFNVKEDKITVVPIFVERVTHNVEHVTRNNGKFVFLTIGRLVPVKNIVLQIEAVREVVKNHPEAELWIVGEGKERKNYELLITNYELQKNVNFFGWQDDVSKFYNQADVFLLTSDYEGWGLVMIEAAGYGLPIIMTDVGCAGEVIKNNESGIVIPIGDKKKLIEAMTRLIEDEGLRKKLGESAGEAVKKLPNKEETMRLYKESWKIKDPIP